MGWADAVIKDKKKRDEELAQYGNASNWADSIIADKQMRNNIASTVNTLNSVQPTVEPTINQPTIDSIDKAFQEALNKTTPVINQPTITDEKTALKRAEEKLINATKKVPSGVYTEEDLALERGLDKLVGNEENQKVNTLDYLANRSAGAIANWIAGTGGRPFYDELEGAELAKNKSNTQNLIEGAIKTIDPFVYGNLVNLPENVNRIAGTIANPEMSGWNKTKNVAMQLISQNPIRTTEQGVAQTKTALSNLTNGFVMNPKEEAKKGLDIVNKPAKEMNQIVEEQNKNVSNTLRTIGDWDEVISFMAPSIGLSLLGGTPDASQALSLSSMGIASSGVGTKEALEKGADIRTSNDAGWTKGGIEVGTEFMTGGAKWFGKGSLDNWATKIVNDKVKNPVVNFLLKKGLGYLGEVGEEVTSDILGNQIDQATTDPNKKWYTKKDFLNTVISTLVTTGIMNIGYDAYNQSQTGKSAYQINLEEMKQSAMTQGLVDEAMSRVDTSNMSNREVNQIRNELEDKITTNLAEGIEDIISDADLESYKLSRTSGETNNQELQEVERQEIKDNVDALNLEENLKENLEEIQEEENQQEVAPTTTELELDLENQTQNQTQNNINITTGLEDYIKNNNLTELTQENIDDYINQILEEQQANLTEQERKSLIDEYQDIIKDYAKDNGIPVIEAPKIEIPDMTAESKAPSKAIGRETRNEIKNQVNAFNNAVKSDQYKVGNQVKEQYKNLEQKSINKLDNDALKYNLLAQDNLKARRTQEPSARREYVQPVVQRKADVSTTIGQSYARTGDYKQQQNRIIQRANPQSKDLGEHTWINSVKDIKTFKEAINDEEMATTPDFTEEMMKEALKKGKIRVYSSYPIEQGTFVTPSKMEAESYAGDGKVYSKEVPLEDVAWIDSLQGQYAKVENNQDIEYNEDDPDFIGLIAAEPQKEKYTKYTMNKEFLDKPLKEMERISEAISRDSVKQKNQGETQGNYFDADSKSVYSYDIKNEDINYYLKNITHYTEEMESVYEKELGKPNEANEEIRDNRQSNLLVSDGKNQNNKTISTNDGLLNKTKESNKSNDNRQSNSNIKELDNSSFLNEKTKNTPKTTTEVKTAQDKSKNALKNSVKAMNLEEQTKEKKKTKTNDNLAETKKDEVLQLKTDKGKKIDLKKTSDNIYERVETPKKTDVMPDMSNDTVTIGDKKVSNFYSNITEKSKFITEENRASLQDNENLKYYRAINNKDTLLDAMGKLDANAEQQIGDFFAKDSFTAEDMATGWILVKRYQDAGNYEAMSNVIETMREKGTKSGQAIQMLGMLDRLTPEGMEFYAQRQLDTAYNKFVENKSKKEIDKYAQDFTLTPEEHQFIKDTMEKVEKMTNEDDKKVEVAKIVKMLSDKLPPEKGSRIKAWMRISMLGNPKTQVRNVVGNAIIQPFNWLGDTLASRIDKVMSKKTGIRTKGDTDFGALAGGFVKGAKEAIRDAKLGIDTRDINLNRFEENIGAKPFYEGHKSKVLNAGAKVLNKTNQILGNVMSGGDRVFYQAIYDNSIKNQMKLNNVDTPTQEMMQIAEQEALSRTWNDSNEYTKAVLQIRNAMNKLNVKGYGLGDVLVPFAKTPANLTKAIVDYSPVGLVRTILKDGKNFKNSLDNGQYNAQLQHKFADSLGKGFAGTILWTAAYALAQAGITSGASDDDKDVANFMRNTLGIQPYSVKIGDKSFTYDWAQPIAAPFAAMADFKRLSEKEEKDFGSIVQTLVSSASNILLEQSFLSSIQDVFNSYEGPAAAIKQQIEDLPARATPTFFKQIADLIDPVQRQTYVKGNTAETVKNKVQVKIPGASKELTAQRDTLGREIKKYGGNDNPLQYAFNVFLNPANTNRGKTSAAAEEIYDVYKNTGDKTVMPRQVGYSENVGGTTIPLSAEERNEWQRLSGEKIEDSVKALTSNPKYNSMSYEDKADVINGIVNYSFAKAKSDMFGTQISTTYKTAAKKEAEGIPIADYYVDRISKRK